jgi:protein SCO1/2
MNADRIIRNSRGPAEAISEEDAVVRREQFVFTLLVAVFGSIGIGGGVLALKLMQSNARPTPTVEINTPVSPPALDLPRPMADFALTNSLGARVTRADLAGRFLVVNLVWTGCSLGCLAVNQRMQEIQGLVARSSDVTLLSLTVDPRTDTPRTLERFGRRFQADTNRWYFLTGDKGSVYELIESSFVPPSQGSSDLVPGGFPGTDRILLVDRSGSVCASFNGMNPNVAGQVTAKLTQLRGLTP